MLKHRPDGAEQPGLRWGPFTARIPFYHTRLEWPEVLQGIVLSAATALGIVPILTSDFGLTFEEAVTCVMLNHVIVSLPAVLFGEPFAAGWITPALPLALTFVVSTTYQTPVARFQIMAALAIDLAVILFVLGVTGLGKRIIEWIPDTLKGGIIMGAAIAAFKRVFLDDAARFLLVKPVATTTALAICLLLLFSQPVQKYKERFKWLALVASLGLLPGFIAAAVVGALPFVHEVEFPVKMGILIPPVGDLFSKVSPLAIGWPSAGMFLAALPLAFIAYIILFGDIVTGMEILENAMPSRPDEKIRVDSTRTHLQVAFRNALTSLIAPFFPYQGALWTGVHVVIVQRWKQGRKSMDSLYGGIASYYLYAIPFLAFARPVVTGLEDLMGVALSLTLVLTGFACAYVAMALPKTQVQQGVVLLTGVSLAIFPPWPGLLIGIVATITMVGRQQPARTNNR